MQLGFVLYSVLMYRHEILTFQLEKEKQFRFDHISIGYVVKTELFFLFQVGKLRFKSCNDLGQLGVRSVSV